MPPAPQCSSLQIWSHVHTNRTAGNMGMDFPLLQVTESLLPVPVPLFSAEVSFAVLLLPAHTISPVRSGLSGASWHQWLSHRLSVQSACLPSESVCPYIHPKNLPAALLFSLFLLYPIDYEIPLFSPHIPDIPAESFFSPHQKL